MQFLVEIQAAARAEEGLQRFDRRLPDCPMTPEGPLEFPCRHGADPE